MGCTCAFTVLPRPLPMQLPPSLSFPASILPAPASFNPQGPVTALLAPPSSLGVPGLAAALPPLPLPPPLDVMSDAQLTKKEARMMVSCIDPVGFQLLLFAPIHTPAHHQAVARCWHAIQPMPPA